MKRRLFTIVSALSLLLFVAVVVLWVRSQFVGDRIVWADVRGQPPSAIDWYNFLTYRSSATVRWDRYARAGQGQRPIGPGGPTHFRWETSPPRKLPLHQHPPSLWNRAGFVALRIHEAEPDRTYDLLIIAVPYWAVALLMFILPLWWAVRLLRRVRELGRRGFDISGPAGQTARLRKP